MIGERDDKIETLTDELGIIARLGIDNDYAN
jgi:hypothetical protein